MARSVKVMLCFCCALRGGTLRDGLAKDSHSATAHLHSDRSSRYTACLPSPLSDDDGLRISCFVLLLAKALIGSSLSGCQWSCAPSFFRGNETRELHI